MVNEPHRPPYLDRETRKALRWLEGSAGRHVLLPAGVFVDGRTANRRRNPLNPKQLRALTFDHRTRVEGTSVFASNVRGSVWPAILLALLGGVLALYLLHVSQAADLIDALLNRL